MRTRILSYRQFRAAIECIGTSLQGKTFPACSAIERQLSSKATSTSEYIYSSKWKFPTWISLGVATAVSGWAVSKVEIADEEIHLLPLAVRQRIFFKYEKRIRDRSSLDKVFEYFSSQEKDGQEFMTPVDMLCAVVPTYPPSESTIDRMGHLDGERRATPSGWNKTQASFLQQFDVDGDGLISYPEFLLLLTLVSIPGKNVKTFFDVVDLDGNGYVDKEEFKVVVDLLSDMANVHTSMVGRSKKLSLDDTSTGLLLKFFGKDGKKHLYLSEFRNFLDKLHEELVNLEFAHYDCNRQGSIPAVDFGRSLVAAADIRHVDRLLDKVDSMTTDMARERISFEDFQAVHGMRRNIHTLGVALEFFRQLDRLLSKEEFGKLLTKVAGVSLSRRVVEIIFAVFDNGRGGLDVPAFLEAMQRRDITWARRRNMDSEGTYPTSLTDL
ncbi:hypothetical protein Vafri_3832 [Volvox africanus]|uniref:EF-hand domain-containing protein n=2 Tax=Volvox africanus TaxID=51714 RepID=A0A8J4ASW2_9CHLO|nr:hypothetical protein Vafri_3832 [Volvox africanus]